MPNNTSVNIDTKIAAGREYRNIRPLEIRAQEGEANSFVVEGYATVFNYVYRLYDGPYYKVDEQIAPSAFDGCDMSDVIVQYDHAGRVFARTSNGTLELKVDDHGLLCRIDLGGTAAGRQLYEEIKGGYTTKMSFGFIVEEDQQDVSTDQENGEVTLRTITKIKKLFDVSAVSLPASDATEISARCLCDGLIAERTEEHRKKVQAHNKTNTLRLLLEVTRNDH